MFPLAAGLSLGVGAFWWALTLRHESANSVTLQDNGRSWVIGAEAQPILPEGLPQELRAAVMQAARTERLQIPADLAALRAPTESFATRRSARANTFRLHSPVGTAVLEAKPRFRWTAVEDATSYRLSISAKGNSKPEMDVTVPATD